MTMKNDATFEVELILTQAIKNLKNFLFNGLVFTKVYNV